MWPFNIINNLVFCFVYSQFEIISADINSLPKWTLNFHGWSCEDSCVMDVTSHALVGSYRRFKRSCYLFHLKWLKFDHIGSHTRTFSHTRLMSEFCALRKWKCDLKCELMASDWLLMRIWCFSDHASQYRLVSIYQLNAHFLYSITIHMLHYNPRHVSSSNLLIFRRTNCIITASGIVTSLITTCLLHYCFNFTNVLTIQQTSFY